MGVLVVLVAIIVGAWFLGQYIRKGSFNRQIDNETDELHDYVIRKCTRNGVAQQEAQQIADNYAEDFRNECARQVNMTWGNIGAVKRAISEIRTEFASEIDARLR